VTPEMEATGLTEAAARGSLTLAQLGRRTS
jgi:hypothetical protein